MYEVYKMLYSKESGWYKFALVARSERVKDLEELVTVLKKDAHFNPKINDFRIYEIV